MPTMVQNKLYVGKIVQYIHSNDTRQNAFIEHSPMGRSLGENIFYSLASNGRIKGLCAGFNVFHKIVVNMNKHL